MNSEGSDELYPVYFSYYYSISYFPTRLLISSERPITNNICQKNIILPREMNTKSGRAVTLSKLGAKHG